MTGRPSVQTATGVVRGVWRGASAAFLGIPFAEAPVGPLRFAAPVAARPWDGERDASAYGPTPQRRPFGDVTTIPEPSVPGDATLNLNVFTPAPGAVSAALPVLVWVHGGGFFAGSPASPWYDGASFNRDGVVTVSLSYRLGFDGFGWIEDAPTNRGLRDLVRGLEWVRDNIAGFGGDPTRVTIAGQSAGGTAVLALLASPAARGLFAQVIAHSPARLALTGDRAQEIGRGFAVAAGVEPTRAGWSVLSEDAVLDAQQAFMASGDAPPPSPAGFVRATLARGGVGLPFVPATGDDVLPVPVGAGLAHGGAGVRLLAGTVAHEFTPMPQPVRDAWSGVDPCAALTEGGLDPRAARAWVEAQPDIAWTADFCGQLVTDLSFRVPLLRSADARRDGTWLYDFRWPAPGVGLSFHCLDLPFAWDLLSAEGVATVAGPNPPRELADAMHGAWVRFISTGDPGWGRWDGHNARVFGAAGEDTYAASRILADALGLPDEPS